MMNTISLINVQKVLYPVAAEQLNTFVSFNQNPVRLASEILTHAANSVFYETEKTFMPARCVSSWVQVVNYHDLSNVTSSVSYRPNISPFFNGCLTVGEAKLLLSIILRTNSNAVITIPLAQRAVVPI